MSDLGEILPASELGEHIELPLSATHEDHAQVALEIASHTEEITGDTPDVSNNVRRLEIEQPLAPQALHPNPLVKKHNAKKKVNPIGVRTWLMLDVNGDIKYLKADKYKLTQKLGVQPRDLRVLDPHLATKYPCAILDRESAIVVNIEQIRCIITVECILVVNPEDENVSPFVEELKVKLAPAQGMGKSKSYPGLSDVASKLQMSSTVGIELPFELKALEVCLDVVASRLDKQTTDLEGIAYKKLDELTRKVTVANLEKVRQIKSTMVRLMKRVSAIREVLEKFLEDDEDMYKLNLSARIISRRASLAERRSSIHVPHSPEATEPVRYNPSSSNSSDDDAEIAEVEMLLEAYFMHLNNTNNRLQTLDEYIQDTEDLVTIQLDQHRNRIFFVSLVLSGFGASMSILTVIFGIFGQNLQSNLQDKPGLFTIVTCVSSGGAILVFIALIIFIRWQNLDQS